MATFLQAPYLQLILHHRVTNPNDVRKPIFPFWTDFERGFFEHPVQEPCAVGVFFEYFLTILTTCPPNRPNPRNSFFFQFVIIPGI